MIFKHVAVTGGDGDVISQISNFMKNSIFKVNQIFLGRKPFQIYFSGKDGFEFLNIVVGNHGLILHGPFRYCPSSIIGIDVGFGVGEGMIVGIGMGVVERISRSVASETIRVLVSLL